MRRPNMRHGYLDLRWCLALLLAASGCTPARTGDARWEQVWPPSLAGPATSGLSPSPSGTSDGATNPAANVAARAPSTPLSSPVTVTDDDRLTEPQRKLIARQINALFEPSASSPATNSNAAPESQPAQEQPESVRRVNYAAAETTSASNVPSTGTAEPESAPAAKSGDPAPAPAPPTPPTTTVGTAAVDEAKSQPADGGTQAAAAAAPVPMAPSFEAPQAASPEASEAANTPAANTPAANTAAGSPSPGNTPVVDASAPATGSPANALREPSGASEATATSAAPATPSTSAASSAESPPSAVAAGHWQTELQKSIASLESELASSQLDPSERVRLEATLRLLYVAAQRRDDAMRTIDQIDVQEQGFWKLGLAGIYELLDPSGPPITGRRSKLALRYFREAVQKLAAASSLDVRNLAICQRVDSFGQFVEFEPYAFKPEQEVILYLEVSNFAVEEKEQGYETELQGSYQILDEAGRRLADYDLPLDQQTCRNVRTDYFLPYRIFLPRNLTSGSYRIQVTLEDKKGKKFGQTPAVAFQIE